MNIRTLYAEILQALRERPELFGGYTPGREVVVADPNEEGAAAKYEVVFDTADAPDAIRCVLVAGEMTFDRSNRGIMRTIHDVGILLLSRVDADFEIERHIEKTRDIARLFLIDDPLETGTCFAAKMHGGAESGFYREFFENTPELYVGGLVLTIHLYD